MNETILYLLERIIRAKMALERLDVAHKPGCCEAPLPNYCTCGADKINEKVDATMQELRIAPDKIKMG